MGIFIICCPVCDVMNFQIKLSLLMEPFFYIIKKSGQKCKYLKNERAFNGKLKVFFIIFKGLLLEQIKTTSLEGDSPTLSEKKLIH